MNPDLNRLYQIGKREERLILGVMSGTSMDGLDLALCIFRGHGPHTYWQVQHYETIPYGPDLRQELSEVVSVSPVDLELLTRLHRKWALRASEMILSQLESWKAPPNQVDLMASHGQTVMHIPSWKTAGRPELRSTLQIGDGDHLAYHTGMICISDFRQKHVAAGGDGAPLAAYGDYLLFRDPDKHRLMVNLGGMANFTYLPAGGAPGNVVSTDTGPGNKLIDEFVRSRFAPALFDDEGKIAASGKVQNALLTSLLENPFIKRPHPKTTGPETFNLQMVEEHIASSESGDINPKDVVATLTRFSAEALRRIARDCQIALMNCDVYLSGGGVHNRELVRHVADCLQPAAIHTIEDLGVPAGAKEALLFAALANETVAGVPPKFDPEKGVVPVVMGKISLPH